MARKSKKRGKWMQAARESMEKRGTVGSFGKATRSKIAAAKRKGGLAKRKAVIAENFKRAAQHRKRKRGATRR